MAEKTKDAPPNLVVRQSYSDQVYHYIKELILSGELRQGDKIVEEKIAKRFGVSRTPIREALTRLQAYGLVYIQPRSYAEVVILGSQEVNDIAQLRLHLEEMIFRLLAARHDEHMLERFRKIAEHAQNSLLNGDKAEYFEVDAQFHQTAADLCGNAQLAEVYQQFSGKVQLLRIAQDVPVERLEIYMRQHFDIIELIRSERSNAIRELLRIHIIHDLMPSELL